MSGSLFLNALNLKNMTLNRPVWLMRQAGRYLPEYQIFRKKMSFNEMRKNAEVAAEITLQPIRRFGFDAAIIFSDILIVGELIGKPFFFKENQGPYLKEPLKITEIAYLPLKKAEDVLGYLQTAIHLAKKELKVPLIGFAGSPFTLASYLIEGKSTKDFSTTLSLMQNHPNHFAKLLDLLSDIVIDLLRFQADAGCEALQIFDTWASLLTSNQYRSVLGYTKKIIQALKPLNKPIILFCKGGLEYSQEQFHLSPEALSVDATVDLKHARALFGEKICLQGNLNPEVLLENNNFIKKETEKILESMKTDPAFIFNLGHGVDKKTPLDAIYTLVETIRNRK